MFQTNPPNFGSIPEDPALTPESHGNAEVSHKSDKGNSSTPEPEFATLVEFSAWIDGQLDDLEANFEGFETLCSVRGFFGR